MLEKFKKLFKKEEKNEKEIIKDEYYDDSNIAEGNAEEIGEKEYMKIISKEKNEIPKKEEIKDIEKINSIIKNTLKEIKESSSQYSDLFEIDMKQREINSYLNTIKGLEKSTTNNLKIEEIKKDIFELSSILSKTFTELYIANGYPSQEKTNPWEDKLNQSQSKEKGISR